MFTSNYKKLGVIQIVACIVIKCTYAIEKQCISSLDFQCRSSKVCIPKTKRCDGKYDCSDQSDEWDCDLYKCEAPLWFRCKNLDCISHAYVCDGENDCRDNSDEEKCGSGQSLSIHPPKSCPKNQWQCSDRLCILSEWVCNGQKDCLDGSDETIGCERNQCDGFKCNNGQCIYSKWRCDDVKDCKDGSDEFNCSVPVTPSQCRLDRGMVFCNASCVNLNHFCDEDTFCEDVNDKSIICRNNNRTCNSLSCTHECVMTELGAKCICPDGYELRNSMEKCVDINECNIYGTCDQKCRNFPGSYSCYCDEYYELQADNRTCKVKKGEPLMVFSSKTEIRGYYLNSGIYFPVAQNLTQSIGVAFDGRYMYWTEIMLGHESIVRSLEDGSHQKILVTSGLDTPEDLAVDWITGNIYFTDVEMQHIGVCTNDGMFCTVLVNKDVQKPRSIVLYPQKGIMFWTDWGSRPEIARAKMDGTEDISFVANGIHWPNGLALDVPNERLYWVDAKIMTLQSINLDGTQRRIILENIIKHPYALAVFENQVIWSDWTSNTIESCDKFTGKNHNILVKQKNNVYGVHVYHPAMQTYDRNPCSMSFCSHICLLSGSRYTCACPENRILGTDKHKCRVAARDQLLVASTSNMLVLIQHQELGKHNETILPVTAKNVTAMAYNSNSGVLFISEAVTRSITAIDIQNGLKEPVMQEKSVDYIVSMDFDNVGNNIYWCDSVRSTVEVLNLNSMARAVLLSDMGKETPISIAVVPNEGVMFVAFQKPKQLAHIDRMQMDGSHRVHVVEEHLMGPIHLMYDATLNRVFWADTGTGTIESTSVEGDDRHSFQSLHQSPISITSLNKNIVWVNHNSKKLFWADKINGGDNIKGVEIDVVNRMSIDNIISIMPRKVEPHPCLKDNGNCSHVCIPNYKEAVCICPFGLKLYKDKVTCIQMNHCEVNEFYCNESNICIKHELRCNHFKDCLFGEDEENCTYHYNGCDSTQFQCKNKKCIKKQFVCDSKYDCSDKSDEDNCNRNSNATACPNNYFKCSNGECIEYKLVCDSRKHCSDGSDEECKNFKCASDQFKCNDGSCIPKKWECDQEYDCNDKSDEHTSCNYRCDAPSFQCNNGFCIDAKLKCNGINDCGDSSDESSCKSTTKSCASNEFRCYDDTCISMRHRCSGSPECSRGEDELNCTTCQTNEFQCDNKKCILHSWLCDHRDDCGDGSDESILLCSEEKKLNIRIPTDSCEGKFRCRNGNCIRKSLLCNGVDNCGDSSDEFGTCSSACSIDNNPCSQLCDKTPSGPQCGCEKGFVLRGDGKTCSDVKECLKEPPICSQICEEKRGSYSCSCHDGFVLKSDMVSCKSTGDSMSLIFATPNEIYQLSPRNYTLRLLCPAMTNPITGLDAQMQLNHIYFSIERNGELHRINLNTNDHDFMSNIERPQKLAVDWTTQNVYFVSNNFPRTSIRMCNFESQSCSHIVDTGINNNITSIAIESIEKRLFYAVSNSHIIGAYGTFIYKCNLDGSNLQKLVKIDSDPITGLAFNTYTRTLFYLHNAGNVYKSDYDGNTQLKIITNLKKPSSLSAFEDHLYFYTPTGYMNRCPLYNNYQSCINFTMPERFTDLFVVHQSSRQPQVPNICSNRCSNLCVPLDNEPRCMCNKKDEDQCEQVKIETKKNASSGSRTTVIIIVVVLFISAIVTGSYYYLQKKKNGTFSISYFSMRFQNPLYGCPQPDNLQDKILNPGEHEYFNPLDHQKNQLKQSKSDKLGF